MANLNTQTGKILLVINFEDKQVKQEIIDNLKDWLEKNTKLNTYQNFIILL